MVADVMPGRSDRLELVGMGAGPGAHDKEARPDVARGQDLELPDESAQRILCRLIGKLGVDRDRDRRHAGTIAGWPAP